MKLNLRQIVALQLENKACEQMIKKGHCTLIETQYTHMASALSLFSYQQLLQIVKALE